MLNIVDNDNEDEHGLKDHLDAVLRRGAQRMLATVCLLAVRTREDALDGGPGPSSKMRKTVAPGVLRVHHDSVRPAISRVVTSACLTAAAKTSSYASALAGASAALTRASTATDYSIL